MSLLAKVRAIFARRRRVEPAPGEQWAFAPPYNGPWPSKDYAPVTILDVQQGWVRYSMGESFNDCRQRVDAFVRMYKRVYAGGKG